MSPMASGGRPGMRDATKTMPVVTSAVLKAEIDRGSTGDKVPGFDPGAAPLGTDDESGGVSPRAELGPAVGLNRLAALFAADPAGTDRAAYRRQDGLIWPMILLALGLVAVAVAVCLLLSR
jgi:hypothetical protein